MRKYGDFKNITNKIKNKNFIMLLLLLLGLLFVITFKTFGFANMNAELIVFDNNKHFNPVVISASDNDMQFYTKLQLSFYENKKPNVVYLADKDSIETRPNLEKAITNKKEVDSKLLEGYKMDLKLSTDTISVYSKKVFIEGVSHLNVFAYDKQTLHIVQYDTTNNDIPINNISRYKYKFVSFDDFNSSDGTSINFKDETAYKELFDNKIKSKPANCYNFDSLEKDTWYIMGVTQSVENKYILNLFYSSSIGPANLSSTSFTPVDFEKRLETTNNRNNRNYSFEYDIDMKAIQREGLNFETIANDFVYHLDSNGNRVDFFDTNYSINYNLDGGTISNNVSMYSMFDETFTLKIPTKEGYEFIGWTGSNGSTPQINVNIEKGSIGNKDYTANWKLINYTIDYNLDGGIIEPKTIQPIIHNLSATYINGVGGSQGSDISSDYQVMYSDYIQSVRTLYFQEANMYLNIALPKEFTGQINFDVPISSSSATILSATDSNNNSVEIKNNSIIVKSKTDSLYVNLNLISRYTTEGDKLLVVSGKADNTITEYNIETSDIILPTPIKNGYKFLGWDSNPIKYTYESQGDWDVIENGFATGKAYVSSSGPISGTRAGEVGMPVSKPLNIKFEVKENANLKFDITESNNGYEGDPYLKIFRNELIYKEYTKEQFSQVHFTENLPFGNYRIEMVGVMGTYNEGDGIKNISLININLLNTIQTGSTGNKNLIAIWEIEPVTEAKTTIENQVYTTTQTSTSNELAAKTYIENIVRTIVDSNLNISLNKKIFTPSEAGSSINPSGIDGSYIFTITVSDKNQSLTTKELILTITAISYIPPSGGGGGSTT